MAYIETKHSATLAAALGETRAASGIFAVFAKLKSAIRAAQRKQQLRDMPSYLLRDIGLSEGDISVLRDQAAFDQRDTVQATNQLR